MKFTVDKSLLEKHISIVSRAINNKTTLPVLGNVLFEVKDGSLSLSTTNLEIAIETTLGVEMEVEGRTTVPVKLLSKYLSLLPDGVLRIEQKENETLSIESPSSKTEIKCIAAEEFPIIPKSKEQHEMNISKEQLTESFSQTVFAAAIDDRRPVLAGVYLKVDGEQCICAASDSYRLAEKIVDLATVLNTSVIIPTQTILEIVRILSKSDVAEVIIKICKNQIIFVVGGVVLTSRLVEGVYPDYTRIIPSSSETTVEISAHDLISIVKRVNLFTSEVSSGIVFEFGEAGITVSCTNSQTGSEKAVYESTVHGPEKKISLNAEYFIDALSNMPSDEITLHLNTPLSPVLLVSKGDETYKHIVMPLKI